MVDISKKYEEIDWLMRALTNIDQQDDVLTYPSSSYSTFISKRSARQAAPHPGSSLTACGAWGFYISEYGALNPLKGEQVFPTIPFYHSQSRMYIYIIIHLYNIHVRTTGDGSTGLSLVSNINIFQPSSFGGSQFWPIWNARPTGDHPTNCVG
jgi:hypothetical protein